MCPDCVYTRMTVQSDSNISDCDQHVDSHSSKPKRQPKTLARTVAGLLYLLRHHRRGCSQARARVTAGKQRCFAGCTRLRQHYFQPYSRVQRLPHLPTASELFSYAHIDQTSHRDFKSTVALAEIRSGINPLNQ